MVLKGSDAVKKLIATAIIIASIAPAAGAKPHFSTPEIALHCHSMGAMAEFIMSLRQRGLSEQQMLAYAGHDLTESMVIEVMTYGIEPTVGRKILLADAFRDAKEEECVNILSSQGA